MPKFEEIAHEGRCDVCGKQTNVAVCASSCGPISLAYCRSCLEAGLEPYGIMLAYISGAGHWPDDINPAYQELVRKNLAFHGKTEEEFAAGNGEGVWVLVDPKTKQAHDTDATGGGYVGILDNDSCYYPGLNAGQLIPFELRGSYRPVANFHSFLSKLPRLTPEGKALLLERIAMYQAGHNRPTDPSDPHYEGPLCCACQY